MAKLNSWFEQDKKIADFRVVYIAEAHPSDGRQVPQNERDHVIIATPQAMADRCKAAAMLRDDIKVAIPIVVDGMEDKVSRAYQAWPDRIYIVDKDGKVAYRGDPGPAGFKPALAQEALDRLVDKG